MEARPRVAGIVLAAGRSTRMGRPKQILPFRGRTVLECVVDNALTSGLHRVVVVLGHEAEAVMPLLGHRRVTTVVNPVYREGQSSSLKAGLGALTAETDAALFLLGDQPLVTPDTINLVIAAFADSPSPIVIPTFEGHRGNPVLFGRETFPRIEALSGDHGARGLFREYGDDIRSIDVQTPAIHFDLDTEEDYLRLLREFPAV
ncbi:molybdenum cofactor cytidylyltransferase [Geobacter hydrogenophilus]|uniref:MobA-like NTP transferase domain-containing protein n=1 Tax=Geobacter hydrogenophilus TaxID=40983 RepID=A0A9W6LCY6_9BACT|nr:molybdenum cofactor cytidylyltransferase [Geobacter hydrogenophilus]MBT0894487.1 molybdenum cofactor cytidylyltransferase [Geobacter hydrogenophilus]GLI39357.1 hypothetical protein GHYDROH2_28580 [Geobacter hydrogenophilus]